MTVLSSTLPIEQTTLQSVERVPLMLSVTLSSTPARRTAAARAGTASALPDSMAHATNPITAQPMVAQPSHAVSHSHLGEAETRRRAALMNFGGTGR